MTRAACIFVLASVASVACGCAGPVAFSANAVDSPVDAQRALQLRFQVVNRTSAPQTLSVGAESVHIESVTRDGKPVAPEEREARLHDDPRALLHDTLPVIEPDGLAAFFVQDGLSDLTLVDGVWHRRAWALTPGKYRVVFSYRYDGPDEGRKVFRGRVVASAVSFKVE